MMYHLTPHQATDFYPYMHSGFQMMPYSYLYQPSGFHSLFVPGQSDTTGDMAENGQAGDQSSRDLSKM